MRLGYNQFFYSNFIILGVHLGHFNKKKVLVSRLANCEFSNFLCLDIKQSFKELKKASLLVEFLCTLKGKLLILTGNTFVLETDLFRAILCKHKSLISTFGYNFPGLVTNFVRPKYGIPSLAFIGNSDRSWYATTECFSFCIPTISLVDLDLFRPFVFKFIVYKILSNSKSSGIIIFFSLIILFSLKLGEVRLRTKLLNFLSYKKTKARKRFRH